MADQVIELPPNGLRCARFASWSAAAGVTMGAHRRTTGNSHGRHSKVFGSVQRWHVRDDVGREHAQSYMVSADKLDVQRLERSGGLIDQATADLKESHADASELVLSRTAQVRYAGQFHEIEIPLPGELKSAEDVQGVLKTFHARHRELYTFDLPHRPVEFRTFSLRATVIRKRDLRIVSLAKGDEDASAALKRKRRCLFGRDWIDTPCYDGARLLAGNRIAGPAIIEEEATTVVIPDSFVCTVDKTGSYLLKRR
jgi:N-methylhydantoinase A